MCVVGASCYKNSDCGGNGGCFIPLILCWPMERCPGKCSCPTVTDQPTETTTFAPDREFCFLNKDDKKALASWKMNKPVNIRIVECDEWHACRATSPPSKLLGMELGYIPISITNKHSRFLNHFYI